MSAITFREWSPSLHRAPRRRSPYVVLRAWFDESGIHQGAPATLLAGFAGDADAFDAAEAAWQAVLDGEGLPYFHYTGVHFRKKGFEDCDEYKRARVLAKLAKVIEDAVPAIRIVSCAYDGVWDPNISDEPHWVGRYPNPYAFLFECLMEALQQWSKRDLGGERVVPVLAHQQQYGPAAESMYQLVAPTNSWPLVAPLAFDEPKQRQALQMADMLNYELYQMFSQPEPGAHLKWPLLSRLWADDAMSKRATLFNIGHNARTLKRLIARGPLEWGPDYAGEPISDEQIAANTEEARRLRDAEDEA